MKIPAISTSVPYSYKSNNAVTSNNTKPSFGFGIDYGDDDYLVANNYEYKEGSGSVFEYFKLLGELVCTLYKERFGSCRYSCTDPSVIKNGSEPIITYAAPPALDDVQDDEIIENCNVNAENQTSTPLNYLDFMDDDEWY